MKLAHNLPSRDNFLGNSQYIFSVLPDDACGFDIFDSRSVRTTDKQPDIHPNVPEKITGTYNEDYNILYIHDIIRKKLHNEKVSLLPTLKKRRVELEAQSKQMATHVVKESILSKLRNVIKQIEEIESGSRSEKYRIQVEPILAQYRQQQGSIKTLIFGEDKRSKEHTDDVKKRLRIIDQYINIASEYIHINLIHNNCRPSDSCIGCYASLVDVAINEEGTKRCPECRTEHSTVIMSKLAKDGTRLNSSANNDDESVENFTRAFLRYQGLQSDVPPDSLYVELDNYFIQHGRPSGDQIKELPLNEKGRRGDTNHAMLWNALSHINKPGIKGADYYEHANLIGKMYWGWELPDVMHFKDTIISHYNKTQQVYYQIPLEQRGRISSLGTQFRLLQHLWAVGHDCSPDEFRIAENQESLRNHKKLWKLMCIGANAREMDHTDRL